MQAARSSRTAILLACTLAAGAVAPPGCSSARTDAAGAMPVKPLPDADGVVAPVAPVAPTAPKGPAAEHTASSIDISDLSRVERDLRRVPLIELRLDAVDAAGAPARIGGAVRVVVDAPGAVPASQTFDLSLRSQAEADERYDPILRQYVLRVEPIWTTEPARGSALDLRVTLTLASGATSEATGSIEW